MPLKRFHAPRSVNCSDADRIVPADSISRTTPRVGSGRSRNNGGAGALMSRERNMLVAARADECQRERRFRRELPLDARAVVKRERNRHVGRELNDARGLRGERLAGRERIRVTRIDEDDAFEVLAVVPQQILNRPGSGAIVEDAGAAANDRAALLARRDTRTKPAARCCCRRGRSSASRSGRRRRS